MNRNLVEIALQELGAEDRALLELSVVREVSDEDIADLLGVDIARVLIKREDALGRVSALIDESPADVLRTMRELPAARWRTDRPRPPMEPEPAPEPEPEPEPAAAPERPPAAGRGRFMLALLGGVSVTLVVVVILALTGDDDSDPAPSGPAAQAGGGPGALEPLAGSQGRGSAAVEEAGGRSRLRLAVRGLPTPSSGGYVVWLYNSVTDARAVAGARRGRFRLQVRLPEGYRRYRFVDVTREPSDGNPTHSGQSVLRVPLAGLPGAG